jgi:hypothetical protein
MNFVWLSTNLERLMGLENEIEEHQLITAQQRDMRKLTLCFVDESLFLSC